MKKTTSGCLASFLLTLASCLMFSITVHAEPEPTVAEHTTFTINFYNPGDYPPAMPYMSMVFRNLSEENKAVVSQLQDEIDTALKNQGGVVNDEDYLRILEVLPTYIIRLQELGIPSVQISLPRKRIGMILYQE